MMPSRRTLLAAAFCLVTLAASQVYATDLSGHWEGSWGSSKTPHHGVLRAEFCKLNATQYQVNFRGRFFKVFPFHYSVVLNVVSDDGQTVQLQGSSYLGRMFGTFYYNATVTNGCFNSTYTSCKDNGWFRMSKCCG
jgi:hypothetical protein